MSNPYQMKYMSPVAGGWTRNTHSSAEAADEVQSMLSRLKEEAGSLESHAIELESELKRVHIERAVVGKKLRVLSELVNDVDALRSESAPPQPVAAPVNEAEVQRAPRRSRLKGVLSVGLLLVVVLAAAFVALERTGRIPSHITCAFIACNGHLWP